MNTEQQTIELPIRNKSHLTANDIAYLDTQRAKVEYMIKTGTTRDLAYNDLHRIYTTYFVPGFYAAIDAEYERAIVMLKDLYKRYDALKNNSAS